MKRDSYREQDYAFGQTILTLRSAIGLTQAGLAEILGVSRQSVVEWESGGKYPKFNHLQALISLAVQHNAFSTGNEAEEIRALWKASRQKVLLDERWLAGLLCPPSTDKALVSPTSPGRIAEKPQPKNPRVAFNNLPFQPTPFIGRADELNEIATLLSDPACRLLTLLGPGGIGKTRLAIESASRQTTAYADGVVFVGLASIGDAHQLVLAIGAALNLSFVGHANPTSYLLAELRERHLLLILDNFEHLLAGITLVNDILSNAPQVTVLVTSRERLRLRAEWLFEVEGLAYPSENQNVSSDAAANMAVVAEYSAVQLFIGRIRQIQPRLPLVETTLNSIVQICQYVAGMPLAIELAAASTYNLSLVEVEQRIRTNLDTLAAHFHDVSPRHRSLRATFDYSWELLNESERVLFSRLAVFRGGCTPASAAHVADATIPLLKTLVNKSLLRQNDDPEPRFTFLEPLREYALEQLAARGELAAQQQAHARYFLALAQAAPGQWGNTREDEITVQLDREHDNLRAALQWARDAGEIAFALQLSRSLWRFWRRGGYISEGRFWLEDLLALDVDTSDPADMNIRLRVIEQAAWLASDQNDYKRAGELFEQARTLRRSLGEAEDDIAVLVNEAFQARAAGEYQHGVGVLEDTIARQRAIGHDDARSRADLGLALYTLGMMLREQGEFLRAAALFEEGIQSFSVIGDREAVAQGWLGLSDIARDQGDPVQVREYCEPALPVFKEFGTQWAVGFALANQGLADYFEGHLPDALTAVENALNLFRSIQNDGALAEGLIILGIVSQTQGDLTVAFNAQVEALKLALVIGPRLVVAMALDGLAITLTQLEQAETAVQCLAASASLRDAMAAPVRPIDQPALDHTLNTLQLTLGETFTDRWAAALTLSPESILDTVLSLSETIKNAAEGVANTSFTSGTRVDWNDALNVPTFYGRESELTLLRAWIIEDHCRVVSVLGMGGIGKSALTVHQMHQVAEHFEVVIWRSLRDLPNCDALLDSLLQVVAPQTLSEMQTSLEHRQAVLLDYMRGARVLLVFDNVETTLQEGTGSGQFRAGYEGIGRFLRLCAETQHQSCVLLTSREKLSELVPLEGNRSPVRSLRLNALDTDSCEQLLSEKGVGGTASDRAHLIEVYAGNPLALKIVAQVIVDLFDGEIAPFQEHGEVIFGGVRQLLSDQFARMTTLEQSVLLWLAILREPSSLDELSAVMAVPVPRVQLLEAIESLHRRSFIERGQKQGSFMLQSVVLEYATAQLIAEVSAEILAGKLSRLLDHGIEMAQSQEYVRQTQRRFLTVPILSYLRSNFPPETAIEAILLTLLDQLRVLPHSAQGYGPANLITLLHLYRGELRGVDMSHLMLRGLSLQGVAMQDASLSGALFRDSIFTETFDAMLAVAISSSGEYWAASSRRGEIRMWSRHGLTLHLAWRAHLDMVWTLTFSADGRKLATGSWDRSLKVWDVATGDLLWTGWHTGELVRLAFSPDDRILASNGGTEIILWNAQNGTIFDRLPQRMTPTGIKWSRDGRLLASSDNEGNIWLWSPQTDGSTAPARKLAQDVLAIPDVDFSPDDTIVVGAGTDNTVKLWDVDSGQLLHTFEGHTARVRRVAWSPDGHTIASASQDQTIWLWDVEKKICRAVLRGHTGEVSSLAYSPDSQTLFSGNVDGTLRVWDTVSGRCIRVILSYATTIFTIDWNPDSTHIVSGGMNTEITIWDGSGETLPQVINDETTPTTIVCSLGWSPDGRYIATSEWDHAIRLWDIMTRSHVELLQAPDNNGNIFYNLAWSPDGQQLAWGTYEDGLIVYDIPTRRRRQTSRNFLTRLRLVEWSPDGRYLAACGYNGIIYVWDSIDLRLIQEFTDHNGMVTCLAWNADGNRVASSGVSASGGEIFVWNVLRGEAETALTGIEQAVSALVWDSEEEKLITGDSDGCLRWWDLQQGDVIALREAHEGMIQALRRSPDKRKLASCGNDGAIMLWTLDTGDYLRTLRHDRPYERLDITGVKGLTETQMAILRALGAVGGG